MREIPNKYWVFILCVLLAAVVFAVFWQVRNFEFLNYDDSQYVSENKHISTGLKWDNIVYVFTNEHGGNFHPLTGLSHILDCQLFGLKPGLHHLVNLLFHIANTLLLFIVFRQMTGAIWQSTFIAALFAVHPLHVEPVVWISSRKDVLSTLFFLLTIGEYSRYVKNLTTRSYILTLVLFILGLLAKPMLVTLPFVLLLLDYWPLKRLEHGHIDNSDLEKKRRSVFTFESSNWCDLIWEKFPFFVVAGISSTVTYLVFKNAGIVQNTQMFPLSIRIGNALLSYIKYIWKMIWPARLAVFYPYPATALPLWQVLATAMLLLSITILVVCFAKKHRYLFVGWFWFLGTLVPVIGLVQVGLQAMADRYTYIPLIGLLTIVAWGTNDLLVGWKYRKVALSVASFAIVLVLSICASLQTSYWRNSQTLFEHALRVTAGNYVACNNLGLALLEQNKFDEAIVLFKRALQTKHNYGTEYFNLGFAYDKLGRNQDAIDAYNHALAIDPNSAEIYYKMGVIYHRIGHKEDAIRAYSQAIKNKNNFAQAHLNLGVVLLENNQFDQAVLHFNQVRQLDPDNPEPYYHLARAMSLKGKINEAVEYLEEAIKLNCNWVPPLNNLAWFIAVRKDAAFYDPTRAVQLAKRACELTGYNDAAILDTLAVAYAAENRFSEAVDIAQKALKIAQSDNNKQMIIQIQQRLDLYKANKPYIEADLE